MQTLLRNIKNITYYRKLQRQSFGKRLGIFLGHYALLSFVAALFIGFTIVPNIQKMVGSVASTAEAVTSYLPDGEVFGVDNSNNIWLQHNPANGTKTPLSTEIDLEQALIPTLASIIRQQPFYSTRKVDTLFLVDNEASPKDIIEAKTFILVTKDDIVLRISPDKKGYRSYSRTEDNANLNQTITKENITELVRSAKTISAANPVLLSIFLAFPLLLFFIAARFSLLLTYSLMFYFVGLITSNPKSYLDYVKSFLIVLPTVELVLWVLFFLFAIPVSNGIGLVSILLVALLF